VLIEGLPLWLAQTNCWIVAPDGPGGECVIIDAPPEPERIVERITHHGLKLVAILNTHGHVDHVGGVGSLVHGHDGDDGHPHDGDHGHGHDDIAVYIHDADRHMLLDPKGTSGTLGAYLGELDVRPPEVIYGMEDGDQVRGAGMTFTCLHTPGHTRGSVCFTLAVAGQPPVLFSGDHLFQGSIGRTDLPGGSHDALMISMAEKILPLADDTAVLPGHGPTTTIGRERVTNPFVVELVQRGGRWQ
jgi:glyoxylase-like metal-dependent hydrolase (beta-lactamase superfamily II)